MKKLLIIVVLLLPSLAYASDLQLGLKAGGSFVRNADFNGGQAKTDFHFMVGMNVSYPLNCRSSFCRGLFLEPGFAFTFPAKTNFGSTRVASTGVIGDYSESLKIYSGDLNLKKHFRAGRKTTFYALTGFGISYFQVTNTHFTDALGVEQSLNISKSSINPNLNVGVGISVEASNKLLIDLGITPHIVFTGITDQSYLMLPLTVSYAF